MLNWLLAAGVAVSAPTTKDQAELQKGLEGALRGCEEWVLNPASWVDGPKPFLAKVGLGGKMGLVDRVDETNLPPPEFRVANHYWRINATLGAGFVLVVSDQLPMCHITGGGDTDLQPVATSVLESEAFKARWKLVSEEVRDGMASSAYTSVKEPRFSITVSRAEKPGERLDRVQLLVTGAFNMSQ
jgi:hypothetical protein